MTYNGSTTMRCVECGRAYPWWPPSERRHWFPSSIYAECWPCAYRRPDPREPLWWRILARLVHVNWTTIGRWNANRPVARTAAAMST